MSLTQHKLKYQPVDNRLLNSISLSAMKAGVECWNRDVKSYLDSSDIVAYHPFKDDLERLPQWDGTDRVSLLAQRISHDAAWVRCFHRWMLGCVAQWMYPGGAGQHANSVAPILISARQGMGKSTFCRKLLPEGLQDYYTDSFDLTQPGDAEHKLTTFGLINLDEFDRLPAFRMAQLKNLMRMERLHVRRAYKQHGEPLPRIANFIATSNRRNLLTDMTGSRRFICVEVEHFIDCHTPIEYEQLYAQLKEELQRGERSWFSKEEEAVIQERNWAYYRVTPGQELLEGVFTLAQPSEEGAYLLSTVQIYTQLKQKNPSALCDCSPTAFSRLLAQVGTQVHTHYGNGYWVKPKS